MEVCVGVPFCVPPLFLSRVVAPLRTLTDSFFLPPKFWHLLFPLFCFPTPSFNSADRNTSHPPPPLRWPLQSLTLERPPPFGSSLTQLSILFLSRGSVYLPALFPPSHHLPRWPGSCHIIFFPLKLSDPSSPRPQTLPSLSHLAPPPSTK